MPEQVARFNIDELFLPVQDRRLRRLPRLLRRSLALVWQSGKREFIVAATLQLVGGLAVGAQVLIGKQVLEGVLATGDERRFSAVLPSLVLLAVVTTATSFASLARAEQQRVLTELVARRSLGEVLDVASAVDLLAFETPGFHDRLERAKVNAMNRPLQIASGVLGFVGAGFAIAGLSGALLVIEPTFLALVLVAYVPAWLATAKSSRVVHQFSTAQTERDRQRFYLAEVLSGRDEAKEVRSFGLALFLRSRYDRLYEERIVELRKVVHRRLQLGLLGGLATSVLTAAAVALLVWFVTTGRISVAEAGAAAGALVLLGQRLRGMAGSTGSLYEASLFLEDFTTFVDAMPILTAKRQGVSPPTMVAPVVAESVTFAYPNHSRPSVVDIDLEIGDGEMVALVGENGSGKTTLAKLLAGLLPPESGRVTWGGIDLASMEHDQLRDRVAVIFQDFLHYDLTVQENIGLGSPDRHDDQAGVEAAARQAGAHGFLTALDEGYATRLGPQYHGGSDLSVGQWQRVALARAFFRDAPLLILDEPTAALDPRAEFEVFQRVRELCQGRSVLLISHRFSTVRLADRIYVLDNGRVVEHGTHKQLMAAGRGYAALFTLQASAYADSKP